eukprot:COSAG04_NODE_14371_length_570_cov_6.134529_1_plen_80_part_00
MYLLNPKAYIPGTKMVRRPSSALPSGSATCHRQPSDAGCQHAAGAVDGSLLWLWLRACFCHSPPVDLFLWFEDGSQRWC